MSFNLDLCEKFYEFVNSKENMKLQHIITLGELEAILAHVHAMGNLISGA